MDGLTNTSPNAKPASGFQQKQFDLLLGRARQMMEHSSDEWMSALKSDPVQGAVTLGTQTVRSLVKMSEQSGQKVDPAVLFHVGVQFVKDIAGLVNAAGLVTDNQLEGFLKEVMQQSLASYLEDDAADGLIKPADKQAAKGLLAKMQSDGDGADAESAQEDAGEEQGEPAGDGPSPDNSAAHEGAEAPAVEQAEGSEEDDPEMANQLAAIRAQRKGAA